jgi:hypothetical protein
LVHGRVGEKGVGGRGLHSGNNNNIIIVTNCFKRDHLSSPTTPLVLGFLSFFLHRHFLFFSFFLLRKVNEWPIALL